jgi:hypothetical protein
MITLTRSLSFRLILAITIIFFIFQNCSYPLSKPPLIQGNFNIKSFKLITNNPKIEEKFCDLFLKSDLRVICISNEKYITNELRISHRWKSQSLNLMKNSSKSLLTLSFGVFISTSGISEFTFQWKSIKNKDVIKANSKTIEVYSEQGIYTVLPFYLGFLSTFTGSILNYYRLPEYAEKYCLKEHVSTTRNRWETNQEDFCGIYDWFLEDSIRQIDLNSIINLMEQN